MRFTNKVVVVTGAARGIGKAIALAFAKEGADIVISDILETEAQEVVKEIQALGRKAIAAKVNVANKAEVEASIQKTIDTFGKIDILVNNAGIVRSSMIQNMTEEQWDSVIDVDLKGTFNYVQAVAPHMMKQKYGKIVNVSSTSGHIGFTGNVNYAAAKGGCDALTKTAAKEFARYGINVNAVAPSIIETELSKDVRENPKLLERYLSWTLLRRFGKPEEVAYAVMFLASDEAAFITGTVLVVDGGQTIAIA
jgi:3-oxoacyl-[acyl-carrier protein] reductase